MDILHVTLLKEDVCLVEKKDSAPSVANAILVISIHLLIIVGVDEK